MNKALDNSPVIEPLIIHNGITAPMMLNNIDTDQIIPSREMKKVSKNGLSDGLFAGQRYLANDSSDRKENPDFILNQTPFTQATILLSSKNFGCGSSREHAAWALHEYGFRVIIAESFGTIFRTNCLRNGMIPITLNTHQITQLHDFVLRDPRVNKITVDLNNKTVKATTDISYEFELESHFQEMLVNGLDFISLTLKHRDNIESFVKNDKKKRPWAAI